MKKSMYVLFVFALSIHQLFGQGPDHSQRCKEEMKKLSFLVGDWKGEATHRGPKGSITVMQQEHIEWKLQEMVMVVEGTGREKNATTGKEEVTFQAMATLNFDPIEQQFKWKSFVKEGYSTNAYFKILETNTFEWGFDIPTGGKTKFTIILDPTKNTWHETGEYSKDGTQWMKFIELNLVKQTG
ncbi:hypothetical protein [Chryseolinea lacunae]|uniref:DUF1579 domain-containing protein n=1 Tax=Chryseolinea lacunae TaxID=2801331 RepID=A0ABS1KMH8_9BACT|nr:hypothetical protein [Chryseolinea lacunae]MBL0740669.1 hypothetical protein [Chryseolinea lacunae]